MKALQVPPQANPPLTGKAPVAEQGADVSKNLFEKNWWLFFNSLAGAINSLMNVETTDLTNPEDPTITAVSVIDITNDSAGKAQKRITVSYTAPSPIGSFTGVSVYLDHPDSSGGLAIADGTQAADGTVPAGGTFAPDYIGNFPYNPLTPTVVFQFNAPGKPEYWRVYLVPSADAVRAPVVQHGQVGESPSYQFLVPPPASVNQGREFAPLVSGAALSSLPSGWATNPLVSLAQSGDQYFEFRGTWVWPTFDQNFQTIGGVNIVLDDGLSRKVIGQVIIPPAVEPGVVSTEADALFASTHLTVQPGSTTYTVWFVSFDKAWRVNTIVSGRTPSISFTITRNTGSAGAEYCPVVTTDGVHALVTVAPVAGADGTSLLRITGYFSAPSDPSFGGAELVVKKPDGIFYTIKSGRLTPLENDISQPPSVESWDFYIRSIDINGLRNTIVNGVTPKITLNVGNAAGQLNLTKALSTSFSSEFQISGGVFKVLNLSATTVVTGILQVGGGGSMVSQMKIFDTLGSLIGFIGDDTSGSGYVGAWFKQARIGGTSPSTAPLQADSSGNLSISGGTISLTGTTGSPNFTVTNSGAGTSARIDGASLMVRNTASLDNTQISYAGLFVIQGGVTVSALTGYDLTLGTGSGVVRLDASTSGRILISNTQVIATRKTGWTAWTGTATRSSKATSTATLAEVAEALKALLDDLISHGLIGT